MSLFKTNELSSSLKNDASAFSISNFDTSTVLGMSAKKLQENIGMPDEKKVISYVTDGAWNMHQLLAYLLPICGNSTLYISTWSMSEEAIRVIAGLKALGYIREASLIISDRVMINNAAVTQYAGEVFDRIAYCKNHSKVTVIRGSLYSATIISTANYSSNRRTEAGTIFFDWKISAFHKKWMENKLNNKSINDE